MPHGSRLGTLLFFHHLLTEVCEGRISVTSLRGRVVLGSCSSRNLFNTGGPQQERSTLHLLGVHGESPVLCDQTRRAPVHDSTELVVHVAALGRFHGCRFLHAVTRQRRRGCQQLLFELCYPLLFLGLLLALFFLWAIFIAVIAGALIFAFGHS